MHTIFGIAPSAETLTALLSSFEANSIPLRDVTVVMPGESAGMIPAEAAKAEPVGDDFSGNPKHAAIGGALGALVGMGVLAVSLVPGLVAIGAGVATMSAIVSGGAGGALGALLGLGLGDEKVSHYQARLKDGATLVAVKIPAEAAKHTVGLFELAGMSDVAVSEDAAILSTR
jgi:hypothetical protein